MISFLEKKGFNCYETAFPPELTSNNSIGFADISEFSSYLLNEKIKSVFYNTTHISAEDYYITKDTMRDVLGSFYSVEDCSEIIKKEVIDYNESLNEIDFSNCFITVFFVLINGFVVYFYFSSEIPVSEPYDKFQEILSSTKLKVNKEKEQYEKNISALKQKLKKRILNDPKFHLATNKDLRRIYITDILDHLDDEYKPLKEVWCGNFNLLRRAARDFVESVWSEYKHTVKK